MLTFSQLAELEKSHRGRDVLSVYVDTSLADPAQRLAWRARLDHQIAELQRSNRAAGGSDGFAAALDHLQQRIAGDPPRHSTPGWIGFFDADGELFADQVEVPMPDLISWGEGARLGPAFRALKQHVPVVTAIVDARAVGIYRYLRGELTLVEQLTREADIGPVDHMGDAPRNGFHVGVRGTTGTDEADRVARAAAERLLRQAASTITRQAGAEGWILLGGIGVVCAELRSLLPGRLAERVAVDTSLHARSRPAEIASACAVAASGLRSTDDSATLRDIAASAAVAGNGAAGPDAVRVAATSGAVQTLFITSAYLERLGMEAEQTVRESLAHGGLVEHVSGDAASALDRDHEGVAARLRFNPLAAASASAAQAASVETR